MPRRLNNWTYANITDFLRDHGFSFFKELEGSHESWIRFGNGGPDKIVEMNFRRGTFPMGTLKKIISQSGIPESEWIDWSAS